MKIRLLKKAGNGQKDKMKTSVWCDRNDGSSLTQDTCAGVDECDGDTLTANRDAAELMTTLRQQQIEGSVQTVMAGVIPVGSLDFFGEPMLAQGMSRAVKLSALRSYDRAQIALVIPPVADMAEAMVAADAAFAVMSPSERQDEAVALDAR